MQKSQVIRTLEYKCSDEKINELLVYIKNSDSAYETATFPNVVRNVRFLKEKKEGVDIMCKILEEERAEGRVEGRVEGEARFAILTEKLLRDSRTEDLLKATNDKMFREVLYQEYEKENGK